MKNKNRSLKSEILLRLIIPVIFFVSIETVLSYFVTLHYVDQTYDRWLLDSARSLMQEIKYQDKKIVAEFPAVALVIFKWDDLDKTYFKIIAEEQGIIAGDSFVPETFDENADWSRPNFFNDSIRGEPVRVVSMLVPRAGSQEKVFVHVAETLNKRRGMMIDILLADLVPQIILALLIGFYLFKAVNKGLRPLRTLAQTLSKRSPGDLSPIPEAHVFLEVQVLTDTLNGLLARLGAVIVSQQRFIANAAHQLRTPLAGLKLQAERALREDDLSAIKPAFIQIKNSADRISHMITQLLVLAKSGSIDGAFKPVQVDLRELARATCIEWAPKALQHKMELSYDGPNQVIPVKGDEVLLRELLANLIENAICYGHEHGNVRVKLSRHPHICLTVEDDGPGIAEFEKDKVFERFYRIPESPGDGCGLGLAIVKEIADLHKAPLFLSSSDAGRGTRIEIRFDSE
ncbi:MAG: sensor histidine kinase [Gammaproteobacteria bacterium HGW-Gammaproteobacteria-3]|nr:MAG: sensor histidine kinase [Gammaproteobacteria bacterium HGW-Gammaproteobacteria-3]